MSGSFAIATSVQSPSAWFANATSNALTNKIASAISATSRQNLRNALQDAGYRTKIHPDETNAGLTDADLTFGFLPGDIERYGADRTGVATSTAAINKAISAMPSTGGCVFANPGSFLLGTQVLANTKNNITFDFRYAKLSSANGLNDTLINIVSCTRCTVLVGMIDGNAAGQTLSSFGVSLNGGSYNKVIGGRVTNCKTYGVYQIGCNYAEVAEIELDNNQQCGLGADVGGTDVIGFKVRDVVLHDNGLLGSGATSGAQIEGNAISGFYYKELNVDGVVAYNNKGSGVTLQNARGFALTNICAYNNYVQGITLASCLYGTGGGFSLDNNDVAGSAGYQNGLAIDDSGVTPASQFNTFYGVTSRNHAGFAVIEKGTANNNTFLGVESSSDGGIFSLTGANSIGQSGNTWIGGVTASKSLLCNGASSGVGYTTGAGGTVAQATSKATGVTLNAPSGQVTMNAASLAANTVVGFTLTNSAISSTDVLVLNVVSGGTAGSYMVNARPSNGSAVIEVRNITGGALAEAIVIAFAVIKGAVS